MNKNLVAAILAAAAISSSAHAAGVNTAYVDGIKGSEWDQANGFVLGKQSFINGSDASGGVVTTNRFIRWDADFVYTAYEFVSSTGGRAFDGVNAYTYGTGVGQTYGDGNDVVIEGGTNHQWAFGGPSGPISAFTPLNYVSGNTYSAVAGNVHTGYSVGTTANFAEFAVARSLINFDSLATVRFGGQSWAYQNHFDNVSTSAVLAPVVSPVPLPVSALGGVALMAGLLGRRNRTA